MEVDLVMRAFMGIGIVVLLLFIVLMVRIEFFGLR